MQSFTASLQEGKLTLEIDTRHFLAEALGDRTLSVADERQFLEFVCRHIFTLTHDVDETGATPSWWTRLSQALALAAAEAGAGVRRRVVVEPPCACDPEEHDGG
jgi:hypothetical protein